MSNKRKDTFNRIMSGSEKTSRSSREETFNRIIAPTLAEGVDSDYINSFLDMSQRHINGVDKDSKGITYGTAGNTYNKYKTRTENLSEQSKKVRAYYNTNKTSIDQKTYDDMMSYLDSFDSNSKNALDYFKNQSDFYSQFASQADYDKWDSGWLGESSAENSTQDKINARTKVYATNVAKINALNAEIDNLRSQHKLGNVSKAAKKEIDDLVKQRDALETENNQYKRTQFVVDHYQRYTKNNDFNTVSQGRDFANPTREELMQNDLATEDYSLWYQDVVGTDSATGEYILRDGRRISQPKDLEIPDKVGMFLKASSGDITNAYNELLATNGNYTRTYENVIQEGETNYWNELDEHDLDVYYYLLNSEGQASAYKFLEDMSAELGRRHEDTVLREYTDEYNKASQLEKIAFDLASVPTNIIGGTAGFIDDASNILKGNDINPYSAAHRATNFTNVVRGTRANDIAEKTNNAEIPFINFGWGDAYQAVMSGIDSLVGAKMLGHGYTAFMGMGAASSQAKDLYEKGASNEQIVLGSLASGTAEALFEYLSLDKLIKTSQTDSFVALVKQVAEQAGVEASEEMFTEIANTISDALIMRSQSEWQKAYDEGGFWNAFGESVSKTLSAGLGGAISGGGMAVGNSGLNLANYNISESRYYKNAYGDVQNELVAQGLESEEGSNSRKIAEKYQKKLDEGKNLKGSEIAKIVNANESAINDEESSAKKESVLDTIEALEVGENVGKDIVSYFQKSGIDSELLNNNISLAYQYGVTNQKERLSALAIPETLRNDIFIAGRESAFRNANKKTEASMARKVSPAKMGEVTFHGDVASKSLNPTQASTVEVSKNLAKMTNLDVNIYETVRKGKKTFAIINGQEIETTANGWFVSGTNKIFVDINAGNNYQGLGLFTLGHESGHYIRDWNANGWKTLADSIVETIDTQSATNGTKTFENLMSDKLSNYKSYRELGWEDYKNKTDAELEEMAYEDVVCDSLASLMTDKDTFVELANKLEKKDKNLWEKLKDFIKNFIDKLDETLKSFVGIEAEDDAGKAVQTATEEMRNTLRDLYTTAFAGAVENFNNSVETKAETVSQTTTETNKATETVETAKSETVETPAEPRKAEEAIKTNDKWSEADELLYRMLEGTATDEEAKRYSELLTSEKETGFKYDKKSESIAPNNMFSERTWTKSEYVTEREKTAALISAQLGVSKEQAYKYIDDINSVAKAIADDRVRLDYDPNMDESATVIKPNSEYKWSVDMSTLCAKRLLFTGTFDAIQKALPNTVFNSEDIVKLRKIMEDRDYQVACGICYVESTRREIGAITNDFIEQYKKAQKTGKPITKGNGGALTVQGKSLYADKNYTPSLADLNTTDIDLVKRDHPDVYEAYLAYMNARGQAKPKLLETRAEYKGEILKHFKSKSAVTARNNAGGLRLQSFSDFEVPHLIDMMQITMDMSRVGLKSQAYTKVPAFADAFGNTGIKINLSLIAKGSGLDSKGNLIFDDVEGIDHKEAFRLRDKYSKNVGTILVGKSDEHIIAAMADPRIDFIIPFHKSSWKESLYDALGLTGYGDYTSTQNEKPIDKNREIKNFDPSEYWDFSKTGDENAQIYLQKCREDGRLPKFPQFQNYPGYWKLLIDFKMYDNDGAGSPQEVVRPIFNDEVNQQILKDYKGGHRSFPVAKDVVDDFVKEYKETKTEVKHSIRNITGVSGKNYGDGVYLDSTFLDNLTESERKELIKEYVKELGSQVFTAFDNDGYPYDVTIADSRRFTNESGKRVPLNGDLKKKRIGNEVKQESIALIDELLLSSDGSEKKPAMHKHDWVDNNGLHNWDELRIYVVDKSNDVWEMILNIANAVNGEKILYDITPIKKVDRVGNSTANLLTNNVPSPKSSVNSPHSERNSYAERVSEITPEQYKEIKSYFGTTNVFNVAGYLLKDGYMLDFSGKHWGDTTSKSRLVDHRDIGEVLPGGNPGAMINMIANGNVRLYPEIGGINLSQPLTKQQRTILGRYITYGPGKTEGIVVDIDEPGGDTVKSFTFRPGVDAKTVLKSIDDYFKNPTQHSDLMRFHMASDDEMLYSERNTSLDTRTLLANALLETAQNDVEKKYIEDYQANIEKINADQQRLSAIRAEIKDLSFGKGKRDTAKIQKLQQEATKLTNRITVFDKKLLRLESTKPLMAVVEREKAKAIKKEKQRSAEALQNYKERVAKTKVHEMEMKKVKADRRDATYIRGEIRKMAEKLQSRLTNATERRYVPVPLVNSVIDVCNAIDPTGRTYYIPGTALVDVEKTKANYDANSKAAEKWANGKQALINLRNDYENLKNSTDYDFSSEYNEEFSSHIAELADVVGDTPLREMTSDQLSDVYDILSDITFMVETATKQIGTNEAISNYQAGQEVIAEMETVFDEKLTTNAVSTFFREWTENPMRAVREMTAFNPDSRLMKLFNDLNEGRIKADKFRMDSQKKFDALRDTKEDEKAFNDAVQNASIEVSDVHGMPVKISKMQAMQAILTYEREQANPNRRHLDAPVRFTDVNLDVKGKYDDAFDAGSDITIDDAFVNRVKAELSAWDMVYMDVAREFFNNDSKNAVNEVTYITMHRLVAQEKAYIPYYVNGDYVAKESDNVRFDATIEGMGMLKSVKDNASQQLVVRGLNTVISDHIEKVAKVYGLTVPVRNFNKVFNMKQTANDGGKPVKVAIRETWGTGGLELVDQAVADLQSPRRGDNSKLLSIAKSGFVSSTLAGNISVWMKQAASYPTAGAVLSTKSLAKGLEYFPVVRNMNNIQKQKLFDEIDAHTPQHYMRRLGLSTQELGEMNQSKGWQNRLNKRLGNWSPMNWIQAMDVWTTAALWVASKAEVESMGLVPGTNQYWNKVTEIYNKVLEETQPMYDPLHRAEITKNKALSNIIMFQTQPIQNSGILREGAMEFKVAKKQYGKDSVQAKTAGKKYAKAVGSQMASHLLFTTMTLMAAAILHKMNPWRDDDKELTPESVGTEFLKEFATNFFGAVVPVFGNYAVAIAEKIAGSSRYDVLSDPTVDKINTTINNFAKIKEPSWENYINLVNDVASYFGIPASNLYKIINGARLHIEDAVNGEFGSFEAGVERTSTQDINISYKAYLDGDMDKFKSIPVKNSNITRVLKPMFLEAYANNDMQTMANIRKYMKATGAYNDDVVKLTQDWIKKSK